MKIRMIQRCVSFGLVLGLISCTCAKDQNASPASSGTIQVGRYTITPEQLAYRQKVEAFTYPSRDAETLAADRLVNAYTHAEILARHDREIQSQDLQREAIRIRTTTQMPDVLQQVEALFEGNEEAFLWVYVLPVLAEQRLYNDLFQGDGSVHSAARLQADQFLQKSKKEPARFRELAEETGAEVSRFTVSRTRGVRPDLGKDFGGPQVTGGVHPNADSPEFQKANPNYMVAEGDEWIKNVLGMLKRREVYGKVIEQEEAIQVVRLLDRENGVYTVEAAVFRKADFDSWLNKEKEKLKVVRRTTVPGN